MATEVKNVHQIPRKKCKCCLCQRHVQIERQMKSRKLSVLRGLITWLADQLINTEFELEIAKMTPRRK